MKKDVTTKEAIKAITEDIAIYILGLKIDNVEFIDKELLRIEKREADIVATCLIDKIPALLHLEIQNDNDGSMAERMLRYRLDIMRARPKLPIHQYIVYIGKEKLTMPEKIEQDKLYFCYTIVDMHTIDCESLIKMDTPDALVLAILCDFKNRSEKDVCFYILNRLSELTAQNSEMLKKYTQMLETLSENRNLKNTIKEVEAMLSAVRIEDLPSYELGLERGMERGMERGIERGVEEGVEMGIEKGKAEVLKIAAETMLSFGIDKKLIEERLGVKLDTLILPSNL